MKREDMKVKVGRSTFDLSTIPPAELATAQRWIAIGYKAGQEDTLLGLDEAGMLKDRGAPSTPRPTPPRTER